MATFNFFSLNDQEETLSNCINLLTPYMEIADAAIPEIKSETLLRDEEFLTHGAVFPSEMLNINLMPGPGDEDDDDDDDELIPVKDDDEDDVDLFEDDEEPLNIDDDEDDDDDTF
ncbi:hypothetical protein [Daejeonella oryzae]|uniref:hypothetical protein n=1 Tax=Daejeonella oryzae TaxID=1122943 RepID=UPI0004787E5C|nr:hypothetical protein [Daejeonella oryzae]